MIRLLSVHNIMSPYTLSFYAALNKLPGVVGRTIFLAPNDSNRPTRALPTDLGFEYRILRNVHAYVESFELPLYVHWGLWSEMRRFRPTVVSICGYHYFASLEVLAFAAAHGIPAVLWSGSHSRSGFVKRRWSEVYKRWVIRRFDAYMTYGSDAKEQLVHYGAAPDRIVVGCNTVDVRWFAARSRTLRSPAARNGQTRLLFVGRLVALKNLGELISAVGRLQQKGLDVSLTIVGDGPERPALAEQVARDGVRGVAFSGFLSGDPLVEAYVNADALVLPSLNEVWGLVVNEAAACGVPSVVSTRCGVVHDVIDEGKTGLTFDPAVPGDLDRALERMAGDAELRTRMGAAVQRRILDCDPAHYAGAMVEAAHLALQRRAG